MPYYRVKVKITYEYEALVAANNAEEAKQFTLDDPVDAVVDIEQDFATTLFEDGINAGGALTMEVLDVVRDDGEPEDA